MFLVDGSSFREIKHIIIEIAPFHAILPCTAQYSMNFPCKKRWFIIEIYFIRHWRKTEPPLKCCKCWRHGINFKFDFKSLVLVILFAVTSSA